MTSWRKQHKIITPVVFANRDFALKLKATNRKTSVATNQLIMKRLVFLICTFIGFQLLAQKIELDLAYKANESQLIVEGKVINSQPFKGDDGFIYTKHELKPNKLFKGVLDSNPFFVITRGGEYEGILEEWSHVLHLSKGDYGVFFLKNRSSNHFASIGEAQGFYSMAKYNSQDDSYFSSIKSSYNIDKQLYEPLKKLLNQSPKFLPTGKEENNCLELIIRSENLDLESSDYQIAVDAKMTNSPKYLVSSKIRVLYDVSEFGDDIVSEGRVEFFHGSYLPTTNYDLNAVDIEPGIFEFEISSNGEDQTLLDIFEKNILSIHLNPIEYDDYPFLFVDENFAKENTVLEDESGASQPQCFIIETDFNSQVDCPEIIEVTPEKVAAGVNDVSLSSVPGTIVITGKNFGNPPVGEVKPAYSDVQFESIDGANSSSWARFLAPERDYISWTNDKIELRVPSTRKDGSTVNCAVTGKIWVITKSGEGCVECRDSSEIYVRFGARNDTWNQTISSQTECNSPTKSDRVIYGGKRRNLVDMNGNGGYNLIIEDMFPGSASDNKKAREQIIKALDVWRCQFGVNVNVVPDEPPYSTDTTTCRIQRSDSLSFNTSVTYMRTASESGMCPVDNDVPVLNFGVLVNAKVLDGTQTASNGKKYKFNIKQNMTQADTIGAYDPNATTVIRDLQGIMIHELGHAFQLRHTTNSEDIMAQGSIQTDKLQRSLSANDEKGGEHIGELGLVGTCNHSAMQKYVCTSGSKNIEENPIVLQVYPNPAQKTLNLESKLLLEPCYIKLFDITGRELMLLKVESRSGMAQLDVSLVASGLYSIQVTNLKNGHRSIQKIVIN